MSNPPTNPDQDEDKPTQPTCHDDDQLTGTTNDEDQVKEESSCFDEKPMSTRSEETDDKKATNARKSNVRGKYRYQMESYDKASTRRSRHATDKISIKVQVEGRLAEDYSLFDYIGKGSYSKVRKAWSKKARRMVAIKEIDLRKTTKSYKEIFLPRELDIIRRVAHNNIMKMYEIINVDSMVCIVCEYADHGDLLSRLMLRKRLMEREAKYMFRQLVEAVRYLHHKDIVHRDLKCENILFDRCDNVKLADFGFARSMKQDDLSTTFCGSKAYASPEILNTEPYIGSAADVWSLGVILYIALTGLMPFDERNIRKMVNMQMKHEVYYHPSVDRFVSIPAKDVIWSILEPEVKYRPGCTALLRHVWFRDIPYRVNNINEAPAYKPSDEDTQPDHTIASQTDRTEPSVTSSEIQL